MPPKDTRAKIVEAAMELFWAKGYNSTSIADILSRTQLNSGSLYHFFPGKQDLLLAVLEAYRDGIHVMLLAPAWAGEDDPIERVFKLLALYRGLIVETDCTYGCPIGSLALELHEADPVVRERLAQNFGNWVAAVRGCYEEGAARFPRGTDFQALAEFTLTIMEGGVMQARTHRDVGYFDRNVAQLRAHIDRLTGAVRAPEVTEGGEEMISTLALFAAAQALATPQLEPMAFLVGHCWRGEFPNGSADTHCFEPVYNGRFIRDRHEVTDGARPYAGETIYGWNAAAGRVEYTYWTLPGGISRGSMTAREGMLDFGDELHRDRTGREIRIGTTWRRIDDTSYEVRVTSTSDPTGNRVTRYTRADLAPIRIDVSMASDTSRTLTHEMVIAAPTEAIYTAVGTVDGWRSWAVPNAWQLPDTGEQFEASYRPGARVGEPGNIVQQFLVRLPNRMVAFRTVRTPPGFPHASAFQRVTNVFELEPFGSATRVRLTSAGYPTGAAGDALLAFFREGNRTSLEQLRTRFATGPIDWAARQSAAANR